MDDLREILIATDLSNASRHAYPWAAGIALAYGAQVTLLHVDEVSDALRTSVEVADYLSQLCKQREDQLSEAQQQLVEWGIPTRVESCRGVPSKQILAVAERRSVGLIVMGKSGGRVIERLLFGSTTKRVLRSTKLPVLVVHQPSGEGAIASSPIPLNRLMVTTDFGLASERGLKAAVQISQKVQARDVLLAHVARVPTAIEKLPAAGIEPIRRDALAGLDLLVKRFNVPQLKPRLLVGSAVAQTLAETANAEKVDLVIIPSHAGKPLRQVFVGDTAEALLRRAVRPVLVLPWAYLDDRYGSSQRSPTA